MVGNAKNVPSFSIGVKLAKNVNPETRNMIPNKFKTPSPDKYHVPTDNPYFKNMKIS